MDSTPTPTTLAHLTLTLQLFLDFPKISLFSVHLFLLAFITGNSSLEHLLEGLCSQIHVDVSWRGFCRNRTGDLQITQVSSPALFSTEPWWQMHHRRSCRTKWNFFVLFLEIFLIPAVLPNFFTASLNCVLSNKFDLSCIVLWCPSMLSSNSTPPLPGLFLPASTKGLESG